jgi:hypothetical protein
MPEVMAKPANEWLDETLEKINEVMMTAEDKRRIETWNEQLIDSWNELKQKNK